MLGCIDHHRAHSELPIGFTGNQGPLSITRDLVGLERLRISMVEHPSAAHELVDFSTTVLIDWVRLQKKHTGWRWTKGPTRT